MQTSGRFGTMNQRRGSAATELYDIEDPGPNGKLNNFKGQRLTCSAATSTYVSLDEIANPLLHVFHDCLLLLPKMYCSEGKLLRSQ